MTASNTSDARPLFIVGMPRSGTKLLRGILNQHPMIAISDVETEFYPFWVAQWGHYGNLSNYQDFEQFASEFRSYPFYGYLADRGEELDTRDWYQACATYSPADVFEALLKMTVRFVPGEHAIWGDKSPSYLRHIELLREHFPTARFIHIVRDVRDYCLSINRAWGKSMMRAAQRWNDDVANAHRAGYGNDDYLEVRYEDLLDDPVVESNRICEFLEVPFDPTIVQLSSSTENLGDARGYTHILRSNTRKYMLGLNRDKRRRIERIAASTLRMFHYDCPAETLPKRVPRLTLVFLKYVDGYNLLKASLKNRGFSGSLRFLFRYNQITGNRQAPRK